MNVSILFKALNNIDTDIFANFNCDVPGKQGSEFHNERIKGLRSSRCPLQFFLAETRRVNILDVL